MENVAGVNRIPCGGSGASKRRRNQFGIFDDDDDAIGHGGVNADEAMSKVYTDGRQAMK